MDETGELHSALFDGTATWLIAQGLGHCALPEAIQGLGRRFLAGGLPIHRISVGGMQLHPVFGAIESTWDATTDEVTNRLISRATIRLPEFQDTPFFHAAKHGVAFARARLEKGPVEPHFPLYRQLRQAGITDYLYFYRDYGRRELELWSGLPQGIEGTVGSFSTRRPGGFSDGEVAYLEGLVPPLALLVKSKTAYELTRALLDTYVGRHAGEQVLNGLIERGSGRAIDCVLWYCDLRRSTALAERLPVRAYLGMLDSYFDCTAETVLERGGEVLKFIGDAVMAIFPFEESRPPGEVCGAALDAALEALAKAGRLNADRAASQDPEIRFGIGLHAGQVVYGNVGTPRRLDFTVIGPAANEVTRFESLCKRLAVPLVASRRFRDVYPGKLLPLGEHGAMGHAGGLEAFTAPAFAEAAAAAGAAGD